MSFFCIRSALGHLFSSPCPTTLHSPSLLQLDAFILLKTVSCLPQVSPTLVRMSGIQNKQTNKQVSDIRNVH